MTIFVRTFEISTKPDLLLSNDNITKYLSLSQDERIAVTEATVKGAGTASMLAGGGGSTGTTSELVEAFDDMSVDSMTMMMPPMHTYKHERGL